MNQECISEMILHMTLIKLIPSQNVKPIILVAACTALRYAADRVQKWFHNVVIVELNASGRQSSHWIAYLVEEFLHVLWRFVKALWQCLEHCTYLTVQPATKDYGTVHDKCEFLLCWGVALLI